MPSESCAPCEGAEFILDWLAERKSVDDLFSSIQDGRYERQKILLARSGATVPLYVLEGDIDACVFAKTARTAAAQTEVWAGPFPAHSRVRFPSPARLRC